MLQAPENPQLPPYADMLMIVEAVWDAEPSETPHEERQERIASRRR